MSTLHGRGDNIGPHGPVGAGLLPNYNYWLTAVVDGALQSHHIYLMRQTEADDVRKATPAQTPREVWTWQIEFPISDEGFTYWGFCHIQRRRMSASGQKPTRRP